MTATYSTIIHAPTADSALLRRVMADTSAGGAL